MVGTRDLLTYIYAIHMLVEAKKGCLRFLLIGVLDPYQCPLAFDFAYWHCKFKLTMRKKIANVTLEKSYGILWGTAFYKHFHIFW